MAADPYRSLVRSSSDIVAISDRDAALRWIGPSVTHALGYDPDALIGRNCLELLHHDDHDRAIAFLAALQVPGEPSPPIELRFLAADGAWKWFETILTPMEHDPSIGGIVVNARDVTDRVEALAELQESELLFRGFAAAVPLGLMFVDPEGQLTYANERWSEITGLTADQVHRGVWLGSVHPDDRARIAERLAALDRGTSTLFDEVHRFVRPDGTIIWIRSRGAKVRGHDGAIRGYTGAVDDITAELSALESTHQLASTIDACTEYVVIVAATGRLLYANAAVRELIGIDDATETVAEEFAQLLDAQGYLTLVDTVLAELLDSGHWEGEIALRTGDGTSVPILQSTHAHFDLDGNLAFVAAIGKDISERKALEAELVERERRYRALAQHAMDVVTVTDAQGKVLYVSPSVRQASGYEPEELLGGSGFDMVHPDDRRALDALGLQILEPGTTGSAMYRVRKKDGTYRWVEGVGVNLAHDPAIGGWMVTARDVDDRHRAELLLADQARVLELIARGAPMHETLDVVAALVDRWIDGVCTAVVLYNDDTVRMVASANMPAALRASLDDLYLPTPDWLFREGNGFATIDLARVDGQPEMRDVLASFGIDSAWVAAINDPTSAANYGAVVTYLTDRPVPSEREQYILGVAANVAGVCVQGSLDAQTLAHRARHDPLTDLPNRAYLLEYLDDALIRRSDGETVGLLFIDLDRFKVLNDSLGHGAGDQLLVEVAQRLREATRPGDVVARFGGDEFVVCCRRLRSVQDAIEIAERLLEVIEQPLGSERSHIVVTASIGIAIASRVTTADSLVRDADAAMYRAKERGRAQWAEFDDKLRDRVVQRLQIERELRGALENGELEVYYQPGVALGWDSLLGFEALVRWNHPTRGVLEPAQFLDVAEESGLMRPIGEWVIETACRQAVEWQTRFPEWGAFLMGANLSVLQLADRGLPRRIADILDYTGWAPDRLVLEITEHALVDDAGLVHRSLNELARLQVFLALDDFGTGYSNLTHLKGFPVHAVKIDRSFVAGILRDPEDSVIVKSIADLAHGLHLFVIAEGVESDAQAEALAELGVTLAQGHLWSPPAPAVEVEKLLADSRIRFPAPPRTSE
jgi:diguanylate cyclase (GGDEF)-like protein/PAS domain S-box-containing protein